MSVEEGACTPTPEVSTPKIPSKSDASPSATTSCPSPSEENSKMSPSDKDSDDDDEEEEEEGVAFVDRTKMTNGEGEDIVEGDENRWDAKNFAGEFKDSLGHTIYAVEVPGRAPGKITFHAHFLKPHKADKRFVLTKQRLESGYKRWMCGNGQFQRKESSYNTIVWRTACGSKTNIWTRCAPRGPVFFDPPPELKIDVDATLEKMLEELKAQAEREEEAAPGPSDEDAAMVVLPPSATILPGGGVVIPAGNAAKFEWKTHADEWFPETVRKTRPRVQGDSCTSVKVTSEGMLEWTLEDDWKDLKEQPQDFGVVSPQFNVDSVNNLQLTFFPSGRKNASMQGCALHLNTGTLPQGTGIKFEFWINGNSMGPKV